MVSKWVITYNPTNIPFISRWNKPIDAITKPGALWTSTVPGGPSERQLNFPSCVAFDAEGGLLATRTEPTKPRRWKKVPFLWMGRFPQPNKKQKLTPKTNYLSHVFFPNKHEKYETNHSPTICFLGGGDDLWKFGAYLDD